MVVTIFHTHKVCSINFTTLDVLGLQGYHLMPNQIYPGACLPGVGGNAQRGLQSPGLQSDNPSLPSCPTHSPWPFLNCLKKTDFIIYKMGYDIMWISQERLAQKNVLQQCPSHQLLLWLSACPSQSLSHQLLYTQFLPYTHYKR